METFHVRVAGDDLVFSAAHFITLGDDTCEPLHGHNYRVAAEVHGPLGPNHWVVDFLVLRDALRAVLGDLDHRVLLPTGHRLILVEAGQDEVQVRCGQRRWVFPRPECVLLPIANTTGELLAAYIARRVAGSLERQPGSQFSRVRIEVEECCGMSAVCELKTENSA